MPAACGPPAPVSAAAHPGTSQSRNWEANPRRCCAKAELFSPPHAITKPQLPGLARSATLTVRHVVPTSRLG
eukprot:1172546-Prymnesium_polylepis.1